MSPPSIFTVTYCFLRIEDDLSTVLVLRACEAIDQHVVIMQIVKYADVMCVTHTSHSYLDVTMLVSVVSPCCVHERHNQLTLTTLSILLVCSFRRVERATTYCSNDKDQGDYDKTQVAGRVSPTITICTAALH